MNSIQTIAVSEGEVTRILGTIEGHFADLKAIEIAPAKLTRSLSAFANAEGGELFVGIDQIKANDSRAWRGFSAPEEANGALQIFEQLFPLGEDFSCSFLSATKHRGLVLRLEVKKTRDVKQASDGKVYIRRGAQNLPVSTAEELARLRRNKGLVSFETEPVNANPEFIVKSQQTAEFMREVMMPLR